VANKARYTQSRVRLRFRRLRQCRAFVEDVTVVVDFHWFTDCHLKAIFNINTSRVQLQSSITVDGKDVRLTAGVSL